MIYFIFLSMIDKNKFLSKKFLKIFHNKKGSGKTQSIFGNDSKYNEIEKKFKHFAICLSFFK